MRKLRKIDLNGTAIVEVPSSIEHLNGLEYFNLSWCKNLVSLPESIFNLRSLKTLDVRGCSKLKRLEVELNKNGYLTCSILKGGVIQSSDCFSSLKTLNQQHHQMEAEAPNHPILSLSLLVDLSVKNSWYYSDGFHLSSLKVLSVGNFNHVERESIFSDIFRQSSLRRLSLHNCNLMEEGIKNRNIWNLSSLVSLSLSNCNLMEGEILNHICLLSSLKKLSLKGNHFSSIPASINLLSNLRDLNLSHNPMDEGIIPMNIWNLSSLVSLSLSNCNLREGDILNHICHLSSLKELSLEGNHFRSIPASINGLSNLRGLNLSHCKQLQDIPELPSSLLFLDAHCSDGISSNLSLVSLNSQFSRFKTELTEV